LRRLRPKPLAFAPIPPYSTRKPKGAITLDDLFNSFMNGPDEKGRFGQFGGRFVSETLMPLILDLQAEYEKAKTDDSFWEEMDYLWKHYVGRPSPLYHAERLTEHLGGAKIYFKRDELNHTGAHKINNVLGQIILARRMGKTRIIAETGAGQHGVATATVCAKFGLKCVVYMGAHDVQRQAPNVFRMRLLGAEVIPVTSGRGTLKDAMNDALRDWVTNVRDTFYCIGTVAGPHPYPAMVRDFQSIIGKEVRWQLAEQEGEGRLPDTVIAAIGGGSNAMGLFYDFLDEPSVQIIGVEAGGKGVDEKMEHCASLTGGRPGVLHGNRTYLLQDDEGQILEGYSISAGLDYPGIGPEHSWLHDVGRAQYVSITDMEALEAFQLSCSTEGIIPALEPCHALAHVMKIAPTLPKEHIIVMNMCGRGDKDVQTVARYLGFDMSDTEGRSA
jgi:tryptophan synthase beta chain